MENKKQVPVEVLYRSPELIKVKVPFTEIPIKMNHYFFNKRLKEGYFQIEKTSLNANKRSNY